MKKNDDDIFIEMSREALREDEKRDSDMRILKAQIEGVVDDEN